MNDFERRLTEALHVAVDQAQPSGRLMESVMSRRRRRRARVGVASFAVTAAVALAVPLAIPAVRGSAGSSTSPGSHPGPSRSDASRSRSATFAVPVAQPGTVLQSCSDQIEGQYAVNWRSQSIHVGPLWLIDVRPAYATTDGSSPLPFGNLGVNVADDSYVWVKVAGPARDYFRFLFGAFNANGSYTLRSGETGVTFTSCRAGQEGGIYYPGYTQFWGGFVVAKSPACVTLDVWTRPGGRPTRVILPVGSLRCPRR